MSNVIPFPGNPRRTPKLQAHAQPQSPHPPKPAGAAAMPAPRVGVTDAVAKAA